MLAELLLADTDKLLAPFKQYDPAIPRPEERTCTDCGKTKPGIEFGLVKNRHGNPQRRSKCNACRVERCRYYRRTGKWSK